MGVRATLVFADHFTSLGRAKRTPRDGIDRFANETDRTVAQGCIDPAWMTAARRDNDLLNAIPVTGKQHTTGDIRPGSIQRTTTSRLIVGAGIRGQQPGQAEWPLQTRILKKQLHTAYRRLSIRQNELS